MQFALIALSILAIIVCILVIRRAASVVVAPAVLRVRGHVIDAGHIAAVALIPAILGLSIGMAMFGA